jgi:predicted nucleic acid-binding protein
MRLVVDTNVIAYFLLRTEPFFEESRQLWHGLEEPMAPASWSAELANAVWVVARAGVLTTAEAFDRLRLASMLNIESVDIESLWTGALGRSLANDHSVYDTLFVELAARESVPLATFDQKLLSVFPDIAARPAALT